MSVYYLYLWLVRQKTAHVLLRECLTVPVHMHKGCCVCNNFTLHQPLYTTSDKEMLSSRVQYNKETLSSRVQYNKEKP